MAIKTVHLNGTEQRVDGLGGLNTIITNRGTKTVYASAHEGITAGADGTIAIGAASKEGLPDTYGTVFLLGSGEVSLCGTDDSVNFSSPSRSSGGGGEAGGITQEQLSEILDSYATNESLSELLTEQEAQRAEITQLQSGSSQTGTVIGANLLDNPDFRINQRGVSGTISNAGYFVDRWQLVSGSVTINDDKTLTLNGTIKQILEEPLGADATASASAGTASYSDTDKTFLLTGDNVTIEWAKLEYGDNATAFVPPDSVLELLRCQRYLQKIGSPSRFHSTLCDSWVIDFAIPLSVPLYKAPVLLSGVYKVTNTEDSQSYTGFEFSTFNSSPGSIIIRCVKTSHGLSEALLLFDSDVLLSAEL